MSNLLQKLEGLVASDGRIRTLSKTRQLAEDVTHEFNIEVLPHPEGSDRGGYVLTVTEGDEKCYFDETGGEWFSYS